MAKLKRLVVLKLLTMRFVTVKGDADQLTTFLGSCKNGGNKSVWQATAPTQVGLSGLTRRRVLRRDGRSYRRTVFVAVFSCNGWHLDEDNYVCGCILTLNLAYLAYTFSVLELSRGHSRS